MIGTLSKIWNIAELRYKITFTLWILVVCRIGAYIPVPGIQGEVAVSLLKQSMGGAQNLFQLMDIFSGGAFAHMTVTALGVMPYISASIILQLLIATIPSFQREIRESPDQGKRKISKWTRVTTLALSMFQAGIFAKYALQLNQSNPGIILRGLAEATWGGVSIPFYLTVMITMTTGTLFLMWLGEQISEKGIGNGISLIITIGILSSLPTTLGSIVQQLNLDSQQAGQLSFFSFLVLLALFLGIIMGTILIIQAQRKIPLQYARRIVGRHETQGGSSYIPLKLNYAGVIPVIFASSFLMFPATIGQFLGKEGGLAKLGVWFSPGSTVYMVIYVVLILFFTYFWTATQFRPDQIASDMKKNGAFIPGIRQGKPTQEFLESTMSRITLAGAIFLAFIAVLPTVIGRMLKVDARITQFLGGTSLLILVGVILDTMKQVESHLLMKRYDGFLKKGRTRLR